MDRRKKIQSQLNNEQEITIISEGDLSQWIKIIKPDISAFDQEIKQRQKQKSYKE